MSNETLQTFDDLLGAKMDSAAKTFWWEILGPVVCHSCQRISARDESRFGLSKIGTRSHLFARCTCGKDLTFGVRSPQLM